MSVIKFDKKEIAEIETMLKSAINRNEDIPHVIRNSEPYRKAYIWTVRVTGRKPEDEVELMKEIAGRACWYWFIANRTAHALQYQTEPGFFTDADTEETDVPTLVKEELLKNLRSLRYNIFTNDGNVFLNEAYHNLLDDIIEAITSALYSATQEERPEA